MVVEGRADLLRGGEQDRGLLTDQIERGAERVNRQQLCDAGPLTVLARELGELTVLERQLGRGVELDPLRLAERALGEGREPADRLDLVAEQLEPRGALLGRGEDVEDPAAERELAALGDLVGAFVSGLGEQLGDVAEVDLLAAVEDEALGPQRSVRDRLGEGDGGGDDDGSALGARPSALGSDSSAWRAPIRSPTRCGGGARCDS